MGSIDSESGSKQAAQVINSFGERFVYVKKKAIAVYVALSISPTALVGLIGLSVAFSGM
ncbi:hypothetical protein ASPFODRAFT_45368 [Aspergillus luchuensis CBS 106.47]|uniref:Uncharacterized protein n=1 Tax=Aspergillus luchuensis (strain CBS 106.47) TaxID=1137211 RepID=A0A1M3TLS3_ASPLC|nr:hypothetical protein ASPFODRAFT_45368 [Aspergillus luchuensis CBS 106.47]